MKGNWLGCVLAYIFVHLPVAFADWKIGLPVCLTTGCANYGEQSVKGAQLAVEEINANGGVLGEKIAIVVEDTAEGTSAAHAVTAYKKLRDDSDIKYFVGPNWTPAGLAIAPIAAKEDVIITSPTLGVKEFSAAGDNIFNLYGPDETAARSLAQLAIAKGWKTVAIFSSQQPWDAAQAAFFEDEYKSLGGVIVSKQEPLPTVSDLKIEALKIVSSKPDVIFYSNTGGHFSVSIREVKRLSYKGPQIVLGIDEKLLIEAKGAADGVISCRMAEPTQAFKDMFFAKYNMLAERPSAITYDTLKLYAETVSKAGSFDVKKVIPVFKNTKYVGMAGAFEFNEIGDAVRKPILIQAKGDKFKLYTY